MTGTVQVIECPDSMRELVRAAQSNGRRVGLVPTMGALHEGHLSLVRASTTECDVTAVTIFVNPSQFGANEDLDQYPRSLENDLAALESLAVEWVFAPQTAQMYGPGFSTWISPPEIAATLEGESRPGHFRGVCTIVLKLFQILPADIVYFGQKDYQQSQVIRAMARDLDLPIEVSVQPTVRESDGLALSSRNQYLNGADRQRALGLSRALQAAAAAVADGERSPQAVEQLMLSELRNAGVDEVEYAAVADAQTLAPVQNIDRPCVALIAARVGQTRLIDNRLFE